MVDVDNNKIIFTKEMSRQLFKIKSGYLMGRGELKDLMKIISNREENIPIDLIEFQNWGIDEINFYLKMFKRKKIPVLSINIIDLDLSKHSVVLQEVEEYMDAKITVD